MFYENPEDLNAKNPQASNGKSFDKEKLEKPRPRVYKNARFWVNKGDSSSVVFLDDPADFTDEQISVASDLLNVHFRGALLKEHSAKLTNPWDPSKGPQWGNFFTCTRGIKLSPALRLMAAYTLGLWDAKIGPALGGDLERTQALFGHETFEGLVDLDKGAAAYLADYTNPLGSEFPCTVCDLAYHSTGAKNKDGKMERVFEASITTPRKTQFRTILNLKEYTKRDGTVVKNPMELYAYSRTEADEIHNALAAQGKTNRRKPRAGVGRFQFSISRGGDKSKSLGAIGALEEEYSLEEIQGLNPDAVFKITETTVRNRLRENNGYRLALAFMRTGLSEDQIVEKVLKVFGDGTLIPLPADYYEILMPGNPTYHNMVFEKQISVMTGEIKKAATTPAKQVDASPLYADDDIPF